MLRTLASILLIATVAHAELRVPAFTAYGDPNPDALHVSSKNGITDWKDPAEKVLWFGEFKDGRKTRWRPGSAAAEGCDDQAALHHR